MWWKLWTIISHSPTLNQTEEKISSGLTATAKIYFVKYVILIFLFLFSYFCIKQNPKCRLHVFNLWQIKCSKIIKVWKIDPIFSRSWMHLIRRQLFLFPQKNKRQSFYGLALQTSNRQNNVLSVQAADLFLFYPNSSDLRVALCFFA